VAKIKPMGGWWGKKKIPKQKSPEALGPGKGNLGARWARGQGGVRELGMMGRGHWCRETETISEVVKWRTFGLTAVWLGPTGLGAGAKRLE